MIKLIVGIFLAIILLAPAVFAGADKIKLKDGTILEGAIVARNDHQIYFNNGKEVLHIDFSDIKSIAFGPKPLPQIEEKPSNE